MKEEIQTHKIWEEYEAVKKSYGNAQLPSIFKPIVAKEQYIFSSDKGKISCVKFLDYFRDGKDFWEIYCLEGNLFEDIERFETFEEAKQKCKELLD